MITLGLVEWKGEGRMRSYLTHLECTYCHGTFSADEPCRTCPQCDKVLFPRYDLDAAKAAISRETLKERPPNMWRYFELMPVRDEANIVSLGEGFTPTLKADRLGREMGRSTLYIKDEGINPTATFKARGLSAAVSRAKELGLTRLATPSAGNAAGAMTAYAAKAGMDAYVFMPGHAQDANRKEVAIMGANLTLIRS